MENQVNPDGYPTETAQILQVFPEIWPEILQHIDSSDFHSLINSSLVLREQRCSEIVDRLFPLVLPIVLSQPKKSLDLKTFLNLRQVNHSTKTVVDNLLGDESCPEGYWKSVTSRYYEWSNFVGDERHNLRSICKGVRSDYGISRDNKFFRSVMSPKDSIWGGGGDDLHSDEEISRKNPFLAKYFHVDCTSVSHSRQAPDVMTIQLLDNFMRQHGHNLTHLRFSSAHSIRIVFKVLPHVPNLKVLKLHTTNDVQDQDEYVKQIHYPDLPLLEFLDLDGFYDHTRNQVNTRLNTAFVRKYGPQLKTLSCGDQFFRGWWALGPFYRRKLCNLERIRVSKVTERAFLALSENHFADLIELHFTNFDPSVGFNPYTIQQVVNTLNTFAGSLRSLYLYLDLGDGRSENENLTDASLRIPLSEMNKFYTLLTNVDACWFWRFLEFKCQSLDELHFHHRGPRERTPSLVRMQLMEAFRLVPRLKKIRVTYMVNYSYQGIPERIDIYRDGLEYRKLWRLKNIM